MLKAVLGLFDNEDELRDYLAKDLTIIEPGLELISTNFTVDNPIGSHGIFDILARDRSSNFVIIEIKRSEQAARQALHELSKYIALFMEDQKVDSHRIRCFVVSTHWRELDVPLSLFQDLCPVQVKGFEAIADNQTVVVKGRSLPPVSLESRLSPDMRFFFFNSPENQRGFCEDLQLALRDVSQVRAALIVMEPIGKRERMSLLCTWRVPERVMDDVKDLIFNPEFQEEHYLFPGWELETDLCNWLEDQSDRAGLVLSSDSRATPEKVENYKAHHRYVELVKLGDWPRNDLVNNLAEVMRCLEAKDVSAKSGRANRHHFTKTSGKSAGKAWDYASGAFEAFIGHTPFWLSMYQQMASEISEDATVDFAGCDMRHFYYAVHQALEYEEAELSMFSISITGTDLHTVAVGGWIWDGVTRPQNARANIERTYGSLAAFWGRLFSSVDQERYESVYKQHGFFPYVFVNNLVIKSSRLYGPDDAPPHADMTQGLKAFVTANPAYCEEVSQCLKPIPRNIASVE